MGKLKLGNLTASRIESSALSVASQAQSSASSVASSASHMAATAEAAASNSASSSTATATVTGNIAAYDMVVPGLGVFAGSLLALIGML
jgi:hypothetical protein